MRFLLAAVFLGAFALVPTGAPGLASSTTGGQSSRAAAAAPIHFAPQYMHINPGRNQATDPLQPKRLPALPAKFQFNGSKPVDSAFFRGGASRAARTAGTPSLRVSSQRSLQSPIVYNGLNKAGIAATDNTFAGTPPDSTGAIGPNNYVEVANSVVHVWGRDLSSVSSMQLYQFVGGPSPAYPVCDPQIQWDPAAGRWLMTILFCNVTTTCTSGCHGFWWAYSKTSDPSDLVNGWCVLGVTTDPFILDFDKLGHNSNHIIVGGNFYDESVASSNPPFVSAAILWAPLPPNGTTNCIPTGFTYVGTKAAPLKNGDGTTDAFTPVPVNTTSAAGDGYVLAAYDAGGNVIPSPTANTPTPQSTLAVWHLDSSGVLHQDSDIPVSTYSLPPFAAQMGSTNMIDTLDTRLTQAVGDPVTGIWTQHTVSGGAFSKVTWYELGLSGSALTLLQTGDVASVTDFIFNAAISPNSAGRGAAIFYNKSSSATLPSIAGRIRVNSTPAGALEPGELSLATSGGPVTETVSCNRLPGAPCRWGDYSAASPDPANPYLVWGTNEINLAAGSPPAWRDQNFAVVAAIPPVAPSSVTATSGDDGFSCVSWTAPPGDLSVTSYTITAYQGPTVVRTVTVSAPAATGCINGLSDGTPYTFTVIATNLAGAGPESAHSALATPSRGAAPSTPGTAPTRPPVNQAPTPPPPPPR